MAVDPNGRHCHRVKILTSGIYISALRRLRRRSGTGPGFPAAGAAPPDKRQGLASRVGQAAHDDAGLRSPVPETGAGTASHALTAPRFPVRVRLGRYVGRLGLGARSAARVYGCTA